MQTGVTPRHFVRTSGRSRRLPPPHFINPNLAPNPKYTIKWGVGVTPHGNVKGDIWRALLFALASGPSHVFLCYWTETDRQKPKDSKLNLYLKLEVDTCDSGAAFSGR